MSTPRLIVHVVGARPNFIKLAPVAAALARYPDRFRQTILHTGQHYDYKMSETFFQELDIPQPDANLEIGSGSHASQTANSMLLLEPILLERKPAWVFVYGDTNSTLAGALAAAKAGLPVAHVEAGLRSFDRTMPEELNRIVVDHLSDLLFTPSADGNENLGREGIPDGRIKFVGNVMVDTLVKYLPKTENRPILHELGLVRATGEPTGVRPYALVTLHRPSNVDDAGILQGVMAALKSISLDVRIVFPVHPRTRATLLRLDFRPSAGMLLIDPLGYLDFVSLLRYASVAVVDSGGVQEESTYLGVPCLTVRPNTERPITITRGTNRLVSPTTADLSAALAGVLDGESTARRSSGHAAVPLWDGNASARIADVMRTL